MFSPYSSHKISSCVVQTFVSIYLCCFYNVVFAYMDVYAPHVFLMQCQKRVSDLLKLGLPVFVSHLGGAQTQTQVLCKSTHFELALQSLQHRFYCCLI